MFCTRVGLAKRTGPPPFVTGIGVTITVCCITCADTEPETRRCCVTNIMILTKEFTYDYNLNTDSLPEVISYNTIE